MLGEAKKDKSLVADNRVLFPWSIPFPMFCGGKFMVERYRTISPISYISSYISMKCTMSYVLWRKVYGGEI